MSDALTEAVRAEMERQGCRRLDLNDDAGPYCDMHACGYDDGVCLEVGPACTEDCPDDCMTDHKGEL